MLMRDLVIQKSGKIDREALGDVMGWLRDAGNEVRKMQRTTPAPDTDSAVVEFFEDVADDIANAVTAVVDASSTRSSHSAQAIADVISLDRRRRGGARERTPHRRQGDRRPAHRSAPDRLRALKKIVAGIEAAGKAMFQVLDAAFTLAKDALITVLRAIDQLGRTLGELLSYLADKTIEVIKQGVEALIAIGKEIGNILAQAAAFSVGW